MTMQVTTIAGTGTSGFSATQVNNPYGLLIGPDGGLYFCDPRNQRIRRVDHDRGTTGAYAGTGARAPTPDGALLSGTPLNGPRTIVVDDEGRLYLALREGNAIYRLDPTAQRIEHLAGTGEQGFT